MKTSSSGTWKILEIKNHDSTHKLQTNANEKTPTKP